MRPYILAAILACALVTGLAHLPAQAGDSGKGIVTKSCGRCHGLDRVCANLDKSGEWWQRTARRMIRNGAPITQAQADTAAAYLAGADKSDFCE